ncbi:MAG: 5-formyltetrahydrofolate cyclo-ligase [Endomicrobiia bacterium]
MLNQKQILRKKILQQRLSLSNNEVKRRSEKVIKNLLSLKEFQISKNIMMYYPFKNEVDVLILIELCKEKNFYFPAVNFEKKEIEIKKYNEKFIKNKFGIYEPLAEVIVNKEIIDFIIVPGILFDLKCHRLGYGGGYYDRFLKFFTKTSCGLGYDFQIVDSLPVEENDVKLNYVVLENKIIKRKEY